VSLRLARLCAAGDNLDPASLPWCSRTLTWTSGSAMSRRAPKHRFRLRSWKAVKVPARPSTRGCSEYPRSSRLN